MGETLYRMQLFNPYRTEPAYLAKIVSAEINQHIVFGKFLGICQQDVYKRQQYRSVMDDCASFSESSSASRNPFSVRESWA